MQRTIESKVALMSGAPVSKKARAPLSRVVLINGSLALAVWVAWAVTFGVERTFADIHHYWRISVAMVFGSLVGGGTSEGGGAVMFPVLTKLLEVPAPTARIFTYAIQSIGMIAASISILGNRVPIERRVVQWGAPGAVVGVVVSSIWVAPLLRAPQIRVVFTALLTALAIALLVQMRSGRFLRWSAVPLWGRPERLVVVAAGLAGGFLSGLAGVGENTVMFVILVLLFRVSEQIATPTTVVLLSIVSVAALLSHVFVIGDFHGEVVDYWVAAAPICVVGAPLGARLVTRMSAGTIRAILLVLIGAEFVSTILLVPFTPALATISGIALVLFTVAVIALTRVKRYGPADLLPGGGISDDPEVVATPGALPAR